MATFYPVPPLVMKTELPHEFYILPNNYAANFSTKYGLLPKRPLEYPLAPTIAHNDFNEDVFVMAAELQRAWPELIWDLNKKPNQWEDLLVWFDPYDIHRMGAKFLLQVLYRVQSQNEVAAAEINAIIDEAAIDWVSRHEAVVSNLRPDQDVLQLVSSDETLGMKDREMIMYSIALDKHRHLLHARLAAERNSGHSTPTPFVGPIVHGTPLFYPSHVSHPAMHQHMVGATPVRPIVQQTGTAERLVNGLRLSAAVQSSSAVYTPQIDGPQRHRDVSNSSTVNATSQPRRFSQSHGLQGKPQSRRMSSTRRVRPRGYSTISNRNEIDGDRSSVQRRASNPGTSPPRFVPTSRSDMKAQDAPYQFPPQDQILADPAIIAHLPPRPRALVDAAIIMQSPPRQQSLNDPSIIAQGLEYTPHTSPNQVRRIQYNPEYSQAPYTAVAPYAVPSMMQNIPRNSPVFSPHVMYNPSLPMPINGNQSMPRGFRMTSAHNLPMTSPGNFPMPLQDARHTSGGFVRSNSQQYPLPGAAFHNRQVSQQEHNGQRNVSSNSSASTHTIRPERYEYTGQSDSSYNKRQSISHQPSRVWSQDQKKVVTFNGKTQAENEDPDSKNTIYIRYIKEDFFDSKPFKQILDECGQVCDMTYVRPKNPHSLASGQAFVHFTSAKSVKNAISRLNGYRSNDRETIEASQAMPRNALYNHKDHPYNSKRANSNVISRRPSIHTQSQAYTRHQYSNQQSRAPSPAPREPLTDGFARQISATVQLEQEQFISQRMRQRPLEDISNSKKHPELKARYPMPSKEHLPSKPKFQTPAGSPQKENVPFKHENRTPSSNSRNLTPYGVQQVHNDQKQSGHKKRKGGKKTAESSAQPTPNGSPARSRVICDSKSLANDESKKSSQLNAVSVTQGPEVTSATQVKKPSKGQPELSKQQNMLDETPLSSDNSSRISSTASYTKNASLSRDASGLSLSSATLSDDTLKAESSKDGSAEKSKETTATKSTKSQKKTASQVDIMLDALPADIESAETRISTSELDAKKNVDRQQQENSQAGPSKSRKKNKHAMKESASHDPVRKADAKLVSAQNESFESISSSKTQVKKGSEKKEEPEFTGNSKNQSKKYGDKKSVKNTVLQKGQVEKTFDRTPDVTAPNSENGDQLPVDDLFKLGCDSQFPSLEPARSPASTIADGKRPAAPTSLRGAPPMMGQFSHNHQNQSSQGLKNQNQNQSQTKPAVPVSRNGGPGNKP